MRICLIGTLPEADREAHKGPERTTIGIAEALFNRGHDIVVVSDEGDATTVDVPAKVIGEDLSPGIDRLVRFYLRVHREIDLDSFDVVHAWRPSPGVDFFSMHSVDAAETVERRRPGTFSRRFRLGAKFEVLGKRFTASQATCAVVTAIPNVVDAANHGIEPDRVIPVGVDESFIQQNKNTGGEVEILCVGRVEQRKNQTFPATHTPNEHTLRLVGPRSTDYASEVKHTGVRLEGKLSTEELMRTYQEADVFVLPSIFEGFGLTAVEAMAAGTPVVVADTCGVADHVYDEPIGGVYQFGDSKSYRYELERVIDNRVEYGQNAQSYVRENLTWSTIAAQYENEYERHNTEINHSETWHSES